MNKPRVMRKDLVVDQLRCSACNLPFLGIRSDEIVNCRHCCFAYVWTDSGWRAAPAADQPEWFHKRKRNAGKSDSRRDTRHSKTP